MSNLAQRGAAGVIDGRWRVSRGAEKEAINVPQLELEVEEDLARKEQEERWSGSSKGWLRILGIGARSES